MHAWITSPGTVFVLPLPQDRRIRAAFFDLDEASADFNHRNLLLTMFKRPKSFAILPERSLMQSDRLRDCLGSTAFPFGKLFRTDL